MLGLLTVEIDYHEGFTLPESLQMRLEIRMGYKTGKNDKEWHELNPTTTIDRELVCKIDPERVIIEICKDLFGLFLETRGIFL